MCGAGLVDSGTVGLYHPLVTVADFSIRVFGGVSGHSLLFFLLLLFGRRRRCCPTGVSHSIGFCGVVGARRYSFDI